jgi:hypothetical protein
MTTCNTQSTLLQQLKLQQFIESSSKQNSALKKGNYRCAGKEGI